MKNRLELGKNGWGHWEAGRAGERECQVELGVSGECREKWMPVL